MNAWAAAELARLKEAWPDLRYDPNGDWVCIECFPIPGGWSQSTADIAVRIPEDLPGQAPYGFWVRGNITTVAGGQPSNTSYPSITLSFAEGDWTQFSWLHDVWQPGATPGTGQGMTDFVRSIHQRMSEVN